MELASILIGPRSALGMQLTLARTRNVLGLRQQVRTDQGSMLMMEGTRSPLEMQLACSKKGRQESTVEQVSLTRRPALPLLRPWKSTITGTGREILVQCLLACWARTGIMREQRSLPPGRYLAISNRC